MPELPEVETIRYDLNINLSGFYIKDFYSFEPKMVRPSLKVVKEAIINSQIISFQRQAKIIILELSVNKFLLIHLKMTGRLLIRDQDSPDDRWTRVIFRLKKGKIIKELRFADQRKFGYLKLVSEKELGDILDKFGPEPLKDLSLKKFRKILQKRKKIIKSTLLDQQLISGIGNIYANDALHLAKIHPLTPSSLISEKEAVKLFESIQEVLKTGLKYRGASDNSYLDAFGKKGKYQEHFVIYGKQGQQCHFCKSVIIREKIGGRGSFYCPKCQVVKDFK